MGSLYPKDFKFSRCSVFQCL